MKNFKKVSAPVRVDISACWPDCDPYRQDYGGFLLNAAIKQRVYTRRLNGDFVCSVREVPTNSGLGVSAAIRTTFMIASNPAILDKFSLTDKIFKVYTFENQVLHHRAGLQDQAAALEGGVNLWEFRKDNKVNKYPIERKRTKHLEKRLVIIYTGQKHESVDIHNILFSPKNYKKIIPAIKQMSKVAKLMAGQIDNQVAMTDLINESRELHRKPFSGVVTNTMKVLASRLKGGYLAWKATGAGGGGSMLFYTPDTKALIKFFNKIRRQKNLPKESKIFPVKFDYKGLIVK